MITDDLLIVLNALPEPVFLVSADRQLLLVNTAAAALFGDDLVGKNFVYAIRHPNILNSIEVALAGAEGAETIISLPAPVQATYRVACVAVKSGGEAEAKVVVALNDISNILEAEQMRSEFVANVSHELRSPLTALSGGIETLKGVAKDDPAARERFLDIMEREAARMNRLVGDLLSLSRVEVNERVRPNERVNIRAIVEKVVATLETRSGVEKKPITVEDFDVSWGVPGDEDQLFQVFQNLIDNALTYSRESSTVQISASRRERIAELKEPTLAIEIKDQGEGIPADYIPRLTERFYRVDAGRSREKGGTGLGLAIVKHILNRHRGRLLIESQLGVGSTFTVCLPLE